MVRLSSECVVCVRISKKETERESVMAPGCANDRGVCAS